MKSKTQNIALTVILMMVMVSAQPTADDPVVGPDNKTTAPQPATGNMTRAIHDDAAGTDPNDGNGGTLRPIIDPNTSSNPTIQIVGDNSTTFGSNSSSNLPAPPPPPNATTPSPNSTVVAQQSTSTDQGNNGGLIAASVVAAAAGATAIGLGVGLGLKHHRKKKIAKLTAQTPAPVPAPQPPASSIPSYILRQPQIPVPTPKYRPQRSQLSTRPRWRDQRELQQASFGPGYHRKRKSALGDGRSKYHTRHGYESESQRTSHASTSSGISTSSELSTSSRGSTGSTSSGVSSVVETSRYVPKGGRSRLSRRDRQEGVTRRGDTQQYLRLQDARIRAQREARAQKDSQVGGPRHNDLHSQEYKKWIQKRVSAPGLIGEGQNVILDRMNEDLKTRPLSQLEAATLSNYMPDDGRRSPYRNNLMKDYGANVGQYTHSSGIERHQQLPQRIIPRDSVSSLHSGSDAASQLAFTYRKQSVFDPFQTKQKQPSFAGSRLETRSISPVRSPTQKYLLQQKGGLPSRDVFQNLGPQRRTSFGSQSSYGGQLEGQQSQRRTSFGSQSSYGGQLEGQQSQRRVVSRDVTVPISPIPTGGALRPQAGASFQERAGSPKQLYRDYQSPPPSPKDIFPSNTDVGSPTRSHSPSPSNSRAGSPTTSHHSDQTLSLPRSVTSPTFDQNRKYPSQDGSMNTGVPSNQDQITAAYRLPPSPPPRNKGPTRRPPSRSSSPVRSIDNVSPPRAPDRSAFALDASSGDISDFESSSEEGSKRSGHHYLKV